MVTIAVVPLLSTTCGIFFALVEKTVFDAFLESAKTDHANTSRAVHLWWTNYLKAGVATIVSIAITTLAGGVFTTRQLETYSRPWCIAVAGITFGLGHFVFAPTIADVIKNMCDEEEEKNGQTLTWLKRWLRVHRIRTLVADVPAGLCFAYLVFSTPH
jgi:hypothetical protein